MLRSLVRFQLAPPRRPRPEFVALRFRRGGERRECFDTEADIDARSVKFRFMLSDGIIGDRRAGLPTWGDDLAEAARTPLDVAGLTGEEPSAAD
jgi:hypothetical protein